MYRTFNDEMKWLFGRKVWKLSLDGGFTCPNRDGTLGYGGCTFCAGGGRFVPDSSLPMDVQIENAKAILGDKAKNAGFLAYFQSGTNTYAPVSRLRETFFPVIRREDILGLSIGTRPDCVDEEKLDYLAELAENHVVIVEYGIESCYDGTLKRINRGHDFETARRAVQMTAERGIDVGVHFILGLPGETRQMMLDACSLINDLPIRSVKFHQLQIIKGTRMEQEYAERPQDFERFDLDEYLDFFVDMLERLRPDIHIERFVGEVPPRFVNETPWGLIRNVELLRLLDRRLEERQTWQGRRLQLKI